VFGNPHLQMTHKLATRVITFSGIDGAGKSTQIEGLCEVLRRQGFTVRQIAFWDDVAVLPHLRAGLSLRVFRKKAEPDQAITLRTDKNVRAWYLSLIRAGFYVLDALHFRIMLARLRRSEVDFIVVDRCCYDQLVHVRPRNWFLRAFIHLVTRLAPAPDVALLLDASPDQAFARKPEYPLHFLREYREAYLRLRDFVPRLVVIPPASVDTVHAHILRCVLREPFSVDRGAVGEHEILLRNSP